MSLLLVASLGLFVGLLMGLTGAGGGIVAVPLLMVFLPVTFANAVPVAMLATAMAAGVGTILGLRSGLVRYRAAGLMAAIGILIAPFGIWLSHRLDPMILTVLFAGVLLLVACRTICNRNPELPHAADETLPCLVDRNTGRLIWNSRCSSSLMLSGGLAGLLSGMIGVGGGFVIVPALQRLSVLSMHSVLHTSLAVIFLVSTSVVIGYAGLGAIDWQLAIPFSMTAVFGLALGRRFVSRWSPRVLRLAFAILAVGVAVMLLVRAFA